MAVPDDRRSPTCRGILHAVPEPAQVSGGCPGMHRFGRVSGQLRDHLHRHQVGIGAGQIEEQLAVSLHDPRRVADPRQDRWGVMRSGGEMAGRWERDEQEYA